MAVCIQHCSKVFTDTHNHSTKALPVKSISCFSSYAYMCEIREPLCCYVAVPRQALLIVPRCIFCAPHEEIHSHEVWSGPPVWSKYEHRANNQMYSWVGSHAHWTIITALIFTTVNDLSLATCPGHTLSYFAWLMGISCEGFNNLQQAFL